MSLIASQFPDLKNEMIGKMQATIGLGMMVGPFIGSLMYGFWGYEWAFWIFSFVLFVTICVQ